MGIKILDVNISRKFTSSRGRYSTSVPTYRMSKPKMYFWVKNYNPIDEMKTGYRYNRPYKMYRAIYKEAFKQAQELMEQESKSRNGYVMHGDFPVARWSQYAGCSCPCSPGFILTNVESFYDISVSYELTED